MVAARWAVRQSAICVVETVALIIMLGMVVTGSPGFGYPRW